MRSQPKVDITYLIGRWLRQHPMKELRRFGRRDWAWADAAAHRNQADPEGTLAAPTSDEGTTPVGRRDWAWADAAAHRNQADPEGTLAAPTSDEGTTPVGRRDWAWADAAAHRNQADRDGTLAAPTSDEGTTPVWAPGLGLGGRGRHTGTRRTRRGRWLRQHPMKELRRLPAGIGSGWPAAAHRSTHTGTLASPTCGMKESWGCGPGLDPARALEDRRTWPSAAAADRMV